MKKKDKFYHVGKEISHVRAGIDSLWHKILYIPILVKGLNSDLASLWLYLIYAHSDKE